MFNTQSSTACTTMSDVCLILEGTYPYVAGGVSSWTHGLIQSQPDLTFHLVCILAPNSKLVKKYDLPPNVTGITHVVLQELPSKKNDRRMTKNERIELFKEIEVPILYMQYQANKKAFETLMKGLEKYQDILTTDDLLNSEESWNMLLRMYRSSIGEGSFLNFFWSWRGLVAGMYSILLAELPQAKVYHALCTGYAGLYLAKAHFETERPCVVTEHGIYTNERRIEITAAQWLNDQKTMNLHLIRPKYERDLKDYWIDTFSGYSKLTYEAASEIITLYEGNTLFQIEDGADPSKIRIIPNGIEVEKYEGITRKNDGIPTIALIGRVVPIKDIKTFIRAVEILIKTIPDLRVWIMGPIDEDTEYYEECVKLVEKYSLEHEVSFLGKVNLLDYLNQIDVVVLTSISEAQPLAILEAGAAGIACVATDVGSCRELLYGRSDERPNLGEGGSVCPLSNPESIALACETLLLNPEINELCRKNLNARVKKFYQKKDQTLAYHNIYEKHIKEGNIDKNHIINMAESVSELIEDSALVSTDNMVSTEKK